MVFATSTFAQDNTGEQIIHAFAKEKGIATEENTEQYTQFMKDILLGQYPELTRIGSKYVRDQSDLDLILEYATEQISPLFKDFPVEPEIQEAIPPESGDSSTARTTKVLAYNRTNAINYANLWWNGQNSSYPDFGSQDCTNFISQAMKAGGFSFSGSGDGCRDESTETEWYVYSSSPPIWCLGSNRNWEWSTSWSVVYPFKRYFTYWNSYATSLGWTTSPSTAAYHLSPGDIVQLQLLQDGSWVSYHNMLVTKETVSVGLYMTYHSTDTKDKPLRDIPAGSTQRYVLIRFP
jgi:hypothetical protein